MSRNDKSPKTDQPTITLKFNKNGTFVEKIYLNASSDLIQEAIWKYFQNLIQPRNVGWIGRLFRRS